MAANIQTKTQFGLPIDESFARPASEASLQKAATALRSHGFATEIVDTPEKARSLVIPMLPKDKSIMTATSETLRLSGLADEINKSGKYDAIRPKIEKLDRATQRAEIVKMTAAPDFIVGSVHAVTEDGKIVVASATGGQIGPYVSAAAKVIWVVGSQKVVPDQETAIRRIQFYAYPKEDIRARTAYGTPSAINKMAILNADYPGGRSTLILVRQPIGF